MKIVLVVDIPEGQTLVQMLSLLVSDDNKLGLMEHDVIEGVHPSPVSAAAVVRWYADLLDIRALEETPDATG